MLANLSAGDKDAVNKLSPYQWRNMSGSGLQPQEMRCLVHYLSMPGAPAHASDFLKSLQSRLGTKVPTELDLAKLCAPPAWAVTIAPEGSATAPPGPPPPPPAPGSGRRRRPPR